MNFFRNFLVFLVPLLVLFPGALSAGSYALLVGVSDYDDTIGLADLRGPANDVRLLRDTLTGRGGFDIRVLADGVDGGLRPTRNAILGALDAIVAEAEQGSFVYIHFSGHGTQQADRDGDETDGLDEVFLPADTARAEPGSSVIPNAIVDEELGERIAALRTKGADVWFVLDSCHSGSGLRAGSPRVASRFVEPSALGVTVTPSTQSVLTPAVDATGDTDLPGKYLAFYAAQSSELAREIQVDEASEDSWYGLFSSRLAARLQTDKALSYRQLFQAVLTDLNDGAVPGAARLQTPMWEGDLIDAPVFGGGDTIGVRQFAVDGTRLEAGKLHGLQDNTLVALVADAASGADDILSFAQLDATDATSARLAPVGGTCMASASAPCERVGTVPAAARFARVVSRPLDTALRIAPPSDLETGAPLPGTDPLVQALSAAVGRTNAEHGTNIVIDAEADVLSGVHNGTLWLGSKLAIGQTPVGLAWAPDDGDLVPLLLRINSAENVAEMLSNVAGTPSLLFPSPVEITVQRVVSDISALAPAVPVDLRGECIAALKAASNAVELGVGEALKQCDHLSFGAQGLVQGPARDVNRIYIDSQYCVSVEYQRVEGTSSMANVGQPMTICADCPAATGTVQSTGAERMFFVITEAEPNREALNLEGLMRNCGQDAGQTRSAASDQVSGFLKGLADQNATRGGMGAIGIASIWVEAFSWQVLPRREALQQAGLSSEN
ncbi:MAG: caspase family protein [Pseudomonadota bacterium]